MNYFPSQSLITWGAPRHNTSRLGRVGTGKDSWWCWVQQTPRGYEASRWQATGPYQTGNYRGRDGFETEADAVHWLEQDLGLVCAATIA